MWFEFILSFSAGALGWSLTEYIMHRFVGHRKGSKARFSKEHIRHHAKAGYFTPIPVKTKLALRVVLPLIVAATLLFGTHGFVLSLGFTLAYALYEFLHYSFHAFPPKTKWGRVLRKHHFAHHYHNPSNNHGVSSRFWDTIFGTQESVQIVQIPEVFAKNAMAWVLDPETGNIRDAYKCDYQLRKRSSRR